MKIFITSLIAILAILGAVSALPITHNANIFRPRPLGIIYAEEQGLQKIIRTFCRFLQDPNEEVREQLTKEDLADSARRIALTVCKEFQDPGNEKADAQFGIGAILGGISLLRNAFGRSQVEKQSALGKFGWPVTLPTITAEEQDLQKWIDRSKQFLSYLCDFIQAPDDEGKVTEQFLLPESAKRIALSACKEVQNPGNEKADAQFGLGNIIRGISLVNTLKNTIGGSQVEKQSGLSRFGWPVTPPTLTPSTFPLAKEQDLQKWIDRSKQFLSYLCDFIKAPDDEDKVTEQFLLPESSRRIALSVCNEVQSPGNEEVDAQISLGGIVNGINAINTVRSWFNQADKQTTITPGFWRKPHYISQNENAVEQFDLDKISNIVDGLKTITGTVKNIKDIFGKSATAQFDFSSLMRSIDTDKQDESERAKNELYGFGGLQSSEANQQIMQDLEELTKESEK